MNTKLFSKMTLSSIITASIIFTGCGEKTDEAKKIESPAIIKSEKVEKMKDEKPAEPKKEAMSVYTKYDSVVQDVFKDVAKIAPEGKQMILVFGTNTDPYSDRLKADIQNTPDLEKRLKEDFNSYYFKAHENLRHKQFHEGEMMDVDTKTMIAVYSVTATPTIIFTDDNGKAVIVVPGYMPPKQFLVTMDFMAEGKWKGKDRKNGEVYEALRDFYIAKGINVKKKAE
ncbi:thioredoxin fold domain-containing protein [Arcobacter sp. LA11]|uniref:thioredoxin family protein n=1 Tax=Arcobacter sp. LA11 TaxID=1898176 RepID=UPI00093525E2|nr:thioredoxin fold domain-containing protein [Arcobacter sp. LA11]